MIKIVRLRQKNENILLRHKLRTENNKVIAGVMTKIIAQGVDEGVFAVQEIPETAEIMAGIISTYKETMNELKLNPEQYEDPAKLALQKNAATQKAVERLLGAPTDSMPIIDNETLIAWFTN